MNEIIDYVPATFKSAEKLLALYNATSKQFGSVDSFIEELKNQLYLDTATWGLADWEDEYGLEVNPSINYEMRRARVRAKIRGIGKVGAGLIKSIAEAFGSGEVEVSFDGKINLKFIEIRGIPEFISELEKSIENVKPAHLAIEYDYTYTTWGELNITNWGTVGIFLWDDVKVVNFQQLLQE